MESGSNNIDFPGKKCQILQTHFSSNIYMVFFAVKLHSDSIKVTFMLQVKALPSICVVFLNLLMMDDCHSDLYCMPAILSFILCQPLYDPHSA